MRRHTDYENMVAAYDGLSVAERRELDAHLAECAGCAADMVAYRQMDGAIRGARALKASAGLRVRFSAAMSDASATAAATVPIRPVVREPVIRNPKRQRQPWTWTRALVPVGFLLMFALAIGLSLPRGDGNEGETLQPLVAAPPNQAGAEITQLEFNCDAIFAYDELYKVITAFESENPDIEIHYTPVSVVGTDEASYQAGLADMAAKADVFCAMPGLTELQRGVVADLAPHIANDPAFRPDDFYPGLIRPLAEDGAILSVPTYIWPYLIGYDPQAFDAAGLPYPQPGWTWDDFLAAAVKLTQREGESVGRWGFYEVGGVVFEGRLHAGWSADARTGPDYAEMERILRWYEAMYARERGAALPAALDATPGEPISATPLQRLLKAGKAAMWEDGGANFMREAGAQQAAYPQPNQGAFFGRLGELAMSGQTEHPDLAWRWISYLSQHLPDEKIPARRSLAENAGFWNGLDESSKAAYRYTLDHLAPVNVRMPAEYQLYRDAVIAVAKGEKSVEQALADLHAQVRLRGGP